MNHSVRIAFRNLNRQKKRSFLLGGAIAFGILIVTLVNMFTGGLMENVQDNFAYITDCKSIPEESFDLLKDLDYLILNALRRRPHSVHLSLDEAVNVAERISARKTYFTHMSHEIEHDEVNRTLPDTIELAYDGLVLDFDAQPL